MRIPDRYELKYLVPEGITDAVRAAVAPFCAPDPHARDLPGGRYTITSLYLDSPRHEFYRAKSERDFARLKLRVRTYGDESEGPVFIEIKRKYGEIIAKTRVRAPRASWPELLAGAPPADADPVLHDFSALMARYRAGAVLLARYTREPFVSLVDDYARVTFDRELRYQACDRFDLRGEAMAWHQADDRIATKGTRYGAVLELKCTVDVPRWMMGIIRRFDLLRTGYSKYCTGVARIRDAGRAVDLSEFLDRVPRWGGGND